jgi:hypothetical protein
MKFLEASEVGCLLQLHPAKQANRKKLLKTEKNRVCGD